MKLNEITIEVTQQCPNRCIYCSSLSDMEKTEALDFDTICKVADDAKALGAASVSLSGGEPFLREDIAEIVEYIHAQGLKVRIYSSGIWYSDGQYTSIPSTMLESVKDKIDALIFNYETIDANLYATIMGTKPENLALLDETIKTAIALGIPVEAHLVPMHCNYKQIPAVVSKLYSMGVKNVSFLRLVPQGRVIENRELVELNKNEEQELKQILETSKETYLDKIRLGLPFSAKRAACGTGTVKLTVRYDGYVFPCEAFKEGLMEIGEGVTPENVKETCLKKIYKNSSYLKVVRDGLKAYTKCEDEEHCYGQHCRKQQDIMSETNKSFQEMNILERKGHPVVQAHINMLQGIITRMAQNSTNCKSWAIPIVSAVLMLALEKDTIPNITAYIPLAIFYLLDCYYLGLERKFRDEQRDFIARINNGEDITQDLFFAQGSDKKGWFGRRWTTLKDQLLRTLDGVFSFSTTIVYGVLALSIYLIGKI